MAEENDQTDRIAEIIQGPASASGDQGSMTQQSARDVIEADKYMASKAASRAGGLAGVRMFSVRQPSA